MRKAILAAVSILALLGLGASVRTFPALWAPDSVQGGEVFPVKGTGFLPGTPVNVCAEGFADCMATTTDTHGEFLQFRPAPDVAGFLSLKAIQSAVAPGRGIGGTKVISASVTITVLETTCDGCLVISTGQLADQKGY